MSSDSEDIKTTNFRRKRVLMDSDEEERLENERKAKELEKEKRRQEREQRQKQQEERRKLEKQQEIERKKKELESMNFSILLEPDSNSHTSFTKIRQRIKNKYPHVSDPYVEKTLKKEQKKQKQREREKEAERSNQKEKNRQKEREREKDRDRERDRERVKEQTKPRVSQVKLSKKEEILYELMRRWWYAIPNWSETHSKDYYEKLLKEKGYVLLSGDVYRRAPQEINGLLKVKQIDNFPGVFRRQGMIIDLRDKTNIPSIQNFQNKDVTELMNLLRKALKNQIKDLEQSMQSAPYKSKDQISLLQSLKQKLTAIE